MPLLPEFTDFAHLLANNAAEIIRPLFRTGIAVESKNDKSPVTIADRQAEQVMREMIMARYPDHGIWGEEFGRHQPDAKYCWVLDPIDGTRAFITGHATFGILISLVRMGVPVLGLIDQPITHERWIYSGGASTTLNGQPVKARPCPALDKAMLATTSPTLFSAEDKIRYDKVAKLAGDIQYGWDCYAYAQVASGTIDAVIESGLKPHDFCALRPVVEGAGGIMTDWQGKPLTLASNGQVVASGDRALHAQILELLNQ